MASTRSNHGKAGSLLGSEQFIRLARRCRLVLEPAVLSALIEHGWVVPISGGLSEARLTPAHLWLVARYMKAVTVHHYPWLEQGDATVEADTDAVLETIRADARQLNALLEQFYIGDAEQPLTANQKALVVSMGQYIKRYDPLGVLGELLPYVRSDMRSAMRGQALLVELLRDLLRRIHRQNGAEVAVEAIGGVSRLGVPPSSLPLAQATSTTSQVVPRSRPMVAAVKPVPAIPSLMTSKAHVTAQEAPDLKTSVSSLPAPPSGPKTLVSIPKKIAANVKKPEVSPSVPEVSPSVEQKPTSSIDLPAKPLHVSSGSQESENSLRRRSLTEVITQRSGATLPAIAKSAPSLPTINREAGAGGLRDALKRIREEAERRVAERTRGGNAETSIRPRERVSSGTSMEAVTSDLPEAAQPETPPVVGTPADVGTPTDSKELQVQQLNELRKRYMKEKNWEKLVALYLDKLHLFPSDEDQRKVLINVGVVCERKLDDPERAIDAYERALEIAPDSSLFEALDQLYTRVEAWEKLAALIQQELDATQERDLIIDLKIRKAELMALHLGNPKEALDLFRGVLHKELSNAEREDVLVALAELVMEGASEGQFLLGAAGLLEAHWGTTARLDQLVQIYESLFDTFIQQDEQIMAAEVMSRVASLYQASEKYQEAFLALGQALSCHAGREDTFLRLEVLAEKLDALKDLAAIYEDELDATDDIELAVSIGARLAGVYSQLGDMEGVRRAWLLVSDIDPDNTNALNKLRTLYVISGEVESQLDVLRRLADITRGVERVEVLLQIARLRTAGLDANAKAADRDVLDMDAAVAMIQEALSEVEPGTKPAQSVIDLTHNLIAISDRVVAYQLAERLEQYHSAQGDHQAIITTFEQLAANTSSNPDAASESSRLWGRIGNIHQLHLQQPELAFLYYSKAVRVDPQNTDALDLLEALAQQDGRWDEVAALWEEIIEVDPAVSWIRRLARIYRDRLDNSEQASLQFAELIQRLPGDEESLDFLEDHFSARRDWSSLVEVLESRATITSEPIQRRELLMRAAIISLEKLANPRSAGDAVIMLLDLLDEDEGLEDIIDLYRRASGLDALAELMETHAHSIRNKRARLTFQMRRVDLLVNDLGKTDKAIDLLTSMRGEEPSDSALRVQILKRLEHLYSESGRDLEAYAALRALYEELGTARHKTPAARKEMTKVLTRLASMSEKALGSRDEAAAHYQELLNHDDTNLEVIAELERLYEETSNWKGLYTILGHHAELMLNDDAQAAAQVLKERQVEIAADHLKEPDQERTALLDYIKLRGDKPRLAEEERLIDLARRLGRHEEALQRSEEFLRHFSAPEDIAAMLVEMAETARIHGASPKRAISYLERARELLPTHVETTRVLSELYIEEKEPQESARLWRELLKHEDNLAVPDLVTSCRAMARVLKEHLDQPLKAAGYLERALAEAAEEPGTLSAQDSSTVHHRLGDLYMDLGDSKASLSHLKFVEQLNQSGDGAFQSRLFEQLGFVSLRSGQVEQSERYFFQAIEANGSNIHARLGLAEALMMHGRWQDAQELLEFVRENAGRLVDAKDKARLYAAFGQIHSATGNTTRAVEMYKVALEHDPHNAVALASQG